MLSSWNPNIRWGAQMAKRMYYDWILIVTLLLPSCSSASSAAAHALPTCLTHNQPTQALCSSSLLCSRHSQPTYLTPAPSPVHQQQQHPQHNGQPGLQQQPQHHQLGQGPPQSVTPQPTPLYKLFPAWNATDIIVWRCRPTEHAGTPYSCEHQLYVYRTSVHKLPECLERGPVFLLPMLLLQLQRKHSLRPHKTLPMDREALIPSMWWCPQLPRVILPCHSMLARLISSLMLSICKVNHTFCAKHVFYVYCSMKKKKGGVIGLICNFSPYGGQGNNFFLWYIADPE